MGYTIWPDTDDGEVLEEVHRERQRQDELKRRGKFARTCADAMSDPERLAVLAEEFGEVAREVTEAISDPSRRDVAKLRAELVQTAAVCVAWCEGLDR